MKRNGTDGKPLNIAIFSNLYPPIPSGSSSFTWELSRRLASLNHKVTVITSQVENTAEYEQLDGVDIHRLPAIKLPQLALVHNFKWLNYTFTPGNVKKLKVLFEREQFDIIHQQNHIFDTILSSSFLAKKKKLPLVLTVHTCVQHPNRFFNAILFALDALSRKVIFNKSDSVVSPDPVSKKYVETRHGIIESPVIPYGVEVLPVNNTVVSEIKEKFKLSEKRILISLGHVHAMRDRLDLIAAMPRIIEKFPEARLLIIGDVYISEPAEMVKELGLDTHVIFTGAVPHEQIPAYFAVSEIEAHTFKGPYPGPGIASMEAMSVGLPVVTGEIDETYDYRHFHNWENVVMVPTDKPDTMADALIKLLSDENLRHQIGKNAKRMMEERYSWDTVCNDYIKLYQKIIQNKSK
jgi:glycosyltransferase involved in cell wall biosynthesis